MNKKEYFAVLVSGILVFFLVYFSYKPPIDESGKHFIPVSADDFCRMIVDSWEMKRCLAIVNSESESYCEGAYPDVMRGPCYIDFAVARNNPAICEKAGESRDSCYRSVALERGDSSLCEQVGDVINSRNLCYKDLAQDSGNYSLCEKITDGYIKVQCEAESPGKLYCAENLSDYCLLNDAVTSKSPLKCSNISNQGVRSRCLMLTSYSEKQCMEIVDVDSRDLCYVFVAEKTRDERICGQIVGSVRRDECYLYVAKALNDPSLCELISPTLASKINSKRNYCYYHLGIINRDAGVCSIVRESSPVSRQSDLCFYHAALRIVGMDRVKSYSLM